VTALELAFSRAFPIDDASRARLLAGRDEIDNTLTHETAIAAFEARRPGWLPRVTR